MFIVYDDFAVRYDEIIPILRYDDYDMMNKYLYYME